MRRMTLALFAILLSGCANDLDKKQAVVRQQFGTTAQLFAVAAEKNANASDEIADQAFTASKSAIEKEWADFLARHTADDGRLVSRDDKGNLVPMKVIDLVDAMTKRSDKLLELAVAQKNWKDQQGQYRAAIAKFQSTITLLNQQEVDVQAAKESAQAAFDQVLGTIGGIAAGAGMMVPLAF